MTHAALDLKLADGGREFSNVPIETLQQWARERRVTSRDWVRPPGTEAWLSVADVRELAGCLPGRPSAPSSRAPTGSRPEGPRRAAAGPARTETSNRRGLGIAAPAYGRRRRRRRRQLEETAMEMTPMIDVTFQLLIFFMFANQLANPNPIEVPEARHGRGVTIEGVQMLLVDEQGRYYLGESTRPENGAPALDALLAEVRANAEQVDAPLEVIISAHKRARHVDVRRLVEGLEKIPAVGAVRLGVEELP